LALAVTPVDSAERFAARTLWPGFAKRLRDVGPAAPVVASVASGGDKDKEASLSELYGGTASSDEVAPVDAVYAGIGKVLTISGRTIRPEAQASPEPAESASSAIAAFLKTVPTALLDEAQAFRVKRAQA